MLCEQCKAREATIKYVEVVNGVKTEHNLCGQCAAKLDIEQYTALFEGEFPLAQLLSGLLGIQNTEKEDGKLAEVICPSCGSSYEGFVKDSTFGCADCYGIFGPLLREKIRHLQGSEKHVGKRPDNQIRNTYAEINVLPDDPKKKETDENGEESSGVVLSKDKRLRLYQARLKDALRREDYEEAALLRDEMNKLKMEAE